MICAEESDTPEKPIELDEYVAHGVYRYTDHTIIFSSGYLIVRVTVNGSVGTDSSGNIVYYDLPVSASLNDGEHVSSASCSAAVTSVVNHGSYITLNYKVYAYGNGQSLNQSGSFTIY